MCMNIPKTCTLKQYECMHVQYRCTYKLHTVFYVDTRVHVYVCITRVFTCFYSNLCRFKGVYKYNHIRKYIRNI